MRADTGGAQAWDMAHCIQEGQSITQEGILAAPLLPSMRAREGTWGILVPLGGFL